jgi:hypothetical protein
MRKAKNEFKVSSHDLQGAAISTTKDESVGFDFDGMSATDKGLLAEQMIIGELLKCGYSVCTPLSWSSRFDLLIESSGSFFKVQCKSGRVEDKSTLVFSVATTDSENTKKGYRFDVDFFAVYSPELDNVYLVPIDEVMEDQTEMTLRLEKAKNNQQEGVKYADNYLVKPIFAPQKSYESYINFRTYQYSPHHRGKMALLVEPIFVGDEIILDPGTEGVVIQSDKTTATLMLDEDQYITVPLKAVYFSAT